MIDPTVRNIIRLLVLSFKNSNTVTTRNSFSKYYMLLEEITDFNALTNNKIFWD